MTRTLKIVAVSGSASRKSRTAALSRALAEGIGREIAAETSFIHLADIAAEVGSTLWRDRAPAPVISALVEVEAADLLIVASPVYRAAIPGLFKHFFDLVDQNGLIDTPVLLAASGGSPYHALVLEHQLRPLFGFFQSLTLPIGVYGTDADFTDYVVTGETLKVRIALAVARAVPLLRALHPQD
ncbi:MAG: FMN reductase [Zoogloeaceae bacterium]|jgi:FMN reductase|nr:FMN reductase [Zoogloeaceae bacterium]